MPKKPPSKKQLAQRKRLAEASKKARIDYDQLPVNQQTASRWHQLVRKHARKN